MELDLHPNPKSSSRSVSEPDLTLSQLSSLKDIFIQTVRVKTKRHSDTNQSLMWVDFFKS